MVNPEIMTCCKCGKIIAKNEYTAMVHKDNRIFNMKQFRKFKGDYYCCKTCYEEWNKRFDKRQYTADTLFLAWGTNFFLEFLGEGIERVVFT